SLRRGHRPGTRHRLAGTRPDRPPPRPPVLHRSMLAATMSAARQSAPMPIRTITATRYVTPLREGGSLPAVIEADDQGMYVLKFRGAGQGRKALVAELVAGELARAAGL